jgi:hypothetical protein
MQHASSSTAEARQMARFLIFTGPRRPRFTICDRVHMLRSKLVKLPMWLNNCKTQPCMVIYNTCRFSSPVSHCVHSVLCLRMAACRRQKTFGVCWLSPFGRRLHRPPPAYTSAKLAQAYHQLLEHTLALGALCSMSAGSLVGESPQEGDSHLGYNCR